MPSGVVSFAFGIANFFGAPILGALSDRYGRRPVLLLGFCGLAFTFFATALSTTMWMLIVARLLGGGLQANAAVANAYVADISAPEERAKRFGMLGAMFGIGFILGPAMGDVLSAIDLHLPFFVAGTLAQNPYGQAYIGAYALDLLAGGGCTVKADAPWVAWSRPPTCS